MPWELSMPGSGALPGARLLTGGLDNRVVYQAANEPQESEESRDRPRRP
jgi:hypothetical protein